MTLYKFSGSVEIDDTGVDDRGTIDIWLINTIQHIIEKGPETDDIYEALHLHWAHPDEDIG